jgi:tRNA(Arg) A34 adenosine deaminase TadA
VYPTVELYLPDWVAEVVGDPERCFSTLEERMEFAIKLAARNIESGGGPFGAAIFEIETGRLVAPGVNRVQQLTCSLAHAEAMAILMAQKICGKHNLSAAGLPPMELVTSAQPCVQCYGNLWWSGLQRVVIGARTEDVETLTHFIEGPMPEDWVAQLENRAPLKPITVIRDVLRPQARAVLQRYHDQGGVVYNPSG